MNPTAKATTNQPQAAIQMNAMNPGLQSTSQTHEEHHAKRLRGGGAGKDCLVGALACFCCFEICKDSLECCADIICCPCEMCC